MGEIKKQSINNTILSYIGALIGFLSLLYVQPYFLGSENIGLLRLIYSFSWMIAMIMPLGMGNIAMRFFPKFRNDQNTHNGFLGLLFLMVTFGALVLFLLFVVFRSSFEAYYQGNSPAFVPYYYYCLVFAYILALTSVFNIYSSGLLKTSFTVFLTDVYTRIGFLAVIFLYYFKIIGEVGLVVSYILVYVLQLLLLFAYLLKLKAVSFKINWAFYRTLDRRYLFMFAIIMMFGSFASLGVKFIDSLILGHYVDDLKMIGVYSVCAFIPTILEIPFNSLDRIAQPKIAYAWHHHHVAEIAKIYEMSSRYLFFIGAILFCFLYAGSDFIFSTLPPEYKAGQSVFFTLSLCSLFNLLTGVNTTIITLSEKYFVTATLLIVLIVVAAICNVIFIPIYGIQGAAIATFIAINLYNVLKYVYISMKFKMQPFSRHTIYISISVLICSVFIYLVGQSLSPFLKAVVCGSFTVIVFSVLNIKYNTVDEINKVFRRLRLIK